METPDPKKQRKETSIDFRLKASWLAVSKMYNTVGLPYDFTHSMGFVLLNIDSKSGTPATKIAPQLGMEARSLTRMLKALEDRQIIKRVQDDTDKRKVIVSLTSKGKMMKELARRVVKGFHAELDQLITKEEKEVFLKVTQQVNKVAESTEWINNIDFSDIKNISRLMIKIKDKS